MYKNFYNNIKCFSLVIGHLNLLRSFYYSSANGDTEDKNYILADLAIIKFRNFCKKTVKEIEKLLSNQDAEVAFDIKDLEKIRKLVNSIDKAASDGIMEDLFKNLDKINHFIEFLINVFPKKDLNQVDLREIKNEIVFFKYQIYLS
jgi:hypothetical protein